MLRVKAGGSILTSGPVDPVAAPVLALDANGSIEGPDAIKVPSLKALSSSTISLLGANDVDTFSGSDWTSVTFTDADDLTVGSVDGLTGVQSLSGLAGVRLNTGGGLRLEAPVRAGTLGTLTLDTGGTTSQAPAGLTTMFGRDLTDPELRDRYRTMLGDMVVEYLT